MNWVAGTSVRLYVRREVSPYGWFLGHGREGGDEVHLPYGEVDKETPQVGQEIEIFLFHDTKERLTATCQKPYLQLGKLECLTVADRHPHFGYFLEMGIGRQLLLPYKYFAKERQNVWPQIGDELFVVMISDKEGRMLARLAKLEDLRAHTFSAPTIWKNEWKQCRVTGIYPDGAFVLVDGGTIGLGALGYVHQSAMTHPLRIGEKFSGRIVQVREDGRVNVSTTLQKETARVIGSDQLLTFLKKRPTGAMPYSDKSEAEDIKRRFQMSKAAFKRALGKLMKEGLVRQEGNWTYLAEEESKAGEDEEQK